MRYTKYNINGLIVNSSIIKGNKDLSKSYGKKTFKIKVDKDIVTYVCEGNEMCSLDIALKCLNEGNNGVYWTVMYKGYLWYNRLKNAFL